MLVSKLFQKTKLVAVDLLAKVKIAELDYWTGKQGIKVAADSLIQDTLWAELPKCYSDSSIPEYK